MKRTILAVAIVAVFMTVATAQTGRDIAQKVKDRPDGDTRQSELSMKLINKRGASAGSFPIPSMSAKRRETAKASCSSSIPVM